MKPTSNWHIEPPHSPEQRKSGRREGAGEPQGENESIWEQRGQYKTNGRTGSKVGAVLAEGTVKPTSNWHLEPPHPPEQIHINSSSKSRHSPECKHGLLLHSLTCWVQSVPPYPAMHVQLYPLTSSRQVAPFLQGFELHSITSV